MARIDLNKLEQEILEFWKTNQIFEKSLAKNKSKAKKFVFYEGPPTANAQPGIHFVVPRVFKDLFPRYKTMRGFYVERKGGWDTHGLPVELEVEKELGFNSKEEIEAYGIDKFNQKARASVWRYKEEMEALTERIGFWIDLKEPYITYEPYYIETLWWIVKEFDKKNLLYKDFKVVPYCPRCGTPESSHEVAQGYKNTKDLSVFVKFPISNFQFPNKTQNPRSKTFILSWTTTPWTLPGNLALAVGKDIKYVRVQKNGEFYILAKDLASRVLGKDFEILDEFPGKDLEGLKYQPLFEIPGLSSGQSYRVYLADFVSAQEGTGIVHTAVMYGEDDFKLGSQVGLPKVHTVNPEGKFNNLLAPYGLAGLPVKNSQTEEKIIQHLKSQNLLFGVEQYQHDYPFCWRCGTALLYYALDSWFVKTTACKKELLANNQKINWIPAHIKKGRFGQFLQDLRDWAFSRTRYWGTPLPIWECQSCKRFEVIGSFKELQEKSQSSKKILDKAIKDPHRPFIDKVMLKCLRCQGEMRRVPEVIDVWFDSGSMPFAQAHFPFACTQYQKPKTKNQKDLNKFNKLIDKCIDFPADFIAEAVDQTRGWFYTLLVVSTLLGKRAPYKNVISHGFLLDAKGQKMSKSRGNVVKPWEQIEKYGVDAIRWFLYVVNQPGENKRYDEKELQAHLSRFLLTFWNCLQFFKLAAKQQALPKLSLSKLSFDAHILDQWIASRLNRTIEQVTRNLDKFAVTNAARALELFVSDLSNWYIRRSRERFRQDSKALEILGWVLLESAKLTAPFIPFLSEKIFQELKPYLNRAKLCSVESVHLANWPQAREDLIDTELENQMVQVRDIASQALEARMKAGIKVRQPLKELRIKNKELGIRNKELSRQKELIELIKQEVNVKKVIYDKKIKGEIELDIKLTASLKQEGYLRELLRRVNLARQKANLSPRDRIKLYLEDNPLARSLIKGFEKELKQGAGAGLVAVVKELQPENVLHASIFKSDKGEFQFFLTKDE
jgi:isoleucyl-tRNA synthetase